MSSSAGKPTAANTTNSHSGAFEADVRSVWNSKFAFLQSRFESLEQKFNLVDPKMVVTTSGPNNVVAGVSIGSTHVSSPRPKNLTSPDKASAGEEAYMSIGGKSYDPASRARILINHFDPTTGERRDELADEMVPDVSELHDESIVFTLRKSIVSSRHNNSGELEILNLHLWKLIKESFRHYPGHTFLREPVTMVSPYEAIIPNWEKLRQITEQMVEGEVGYQARSDLRLLLTTLSNGSGDAKLDKYLRMRDSCREQQSTTFEALWILFPPGALVYDRPFMGQEQLFIVRDSWGPWPQPSALSWSSTCFTYDWNGKVFKRTALNLEIECFEGLKPIISLPFVGSNNEHVITCRLYR